ncbi:hypothetical protein [Leptospira mtsangambouensis]|uniref:hypothetical protein n=1 Tax=Leptospira mtsangambouensis TaxID=2484912 RepID=UPI001EE9C585|nr:hypothetical protein [Leptospira mtsangambouensis]MCG6142663.1 hypothetical protein [Leptospira mtsangambouensis]
MPWIIFGGLMTFPIGYNVYSVIIYGILLPLMIKSLFCIALYTNENVNLEVTEKEILISDEGLHLPDKGINKLEVKDIQNFYFDDVFWYSTIGVVMKDLSLYNFIFSKELHSEYLLLVGQFNTILEVRSKPQIKGPDSILRLLIKLFFVFLFLSLAKTIIAN